MGAEFLIASFIVVLLPGTGVLYTLACGLSGGVRSGVYGAIGCTLGIVPHLIVSVLSFAAITHVSPTAFEKVKILGCIYLVYMAISILRKGGPLNIDSKIASHNAFGIILRGILINILNPKLSIFLLAFLPQFVADDAKNPLVTFTLLAAVFMFMTLAIFSCYGLFSSWARKHLIHRPIIMRLLRWFFAAGFIGLSIKLLLTY